MTRVLLTGGSGFIATHILQLLLERGHSVVTTVRNSAKAESIKKAHPDVGPERLDFAIVPDIAKASAFDKVVISDPPFETVIHTASPFHFNVTDIKRDLLDPAINGTIGILHAIKKSAPSVKRVVITSSFGSMMDIFKGLWPGHTYSEEDWNPVTAEQAMENPGFGYSASKTFAEKAAWDFVVEEKPEFTISTILPPLVFGPAVQSLTSLDALNTSNQFIRSFTIGAAKESIPPTTNPVFVDVRDVAFAHVMASEKVEAGGKRFFVVGGYCSNAEIIDIIRKKFPEYRDNLPPPSVSGGELPADVYGFDTRRSVEILGIKYRSLEDCVTDTVRSFSAVKQL
ncbi:NADPH-dependent methylglyoxal reductase-like protein GRE2 [Dactylonectria macrodidyma]|uniref:NADPH-dependent methylglyoxal reductase-like protein GRE2 n=1 Tax=Dactylonectria macrodidyma TaxID=307937 RepID=A0A9P9E1S1_9HYPO|nr:NADPH-dependent methylglyoxal reductase-like protein GRE2 [Dactylonectria macrodidyma]